MNVRFILAIIATCFAAAGLVSFLTLLGINFFQGYEISGMLAGYIASVVIMCLSTIASAILWCSWSRNRPPQPTYRPI